MEMLQDYVESTNGAGPEEEEWEKQEEYRQAVCYGIRNCCSGNSGARDLVRELIFSFICKAVAGEEKFPSGLIPFENPEQMTVWQQLETMIYVLDRKEANCGFERLCKKFEWNRSGMIVSEREVKYAYQELRPMLSEMDKVKILSHLLYACTVGLGVIDTLNYQKGFIEEIQIGMSGRVELQYDYKETLYGNSKENYSRDGVHIMAEGCTIWMRNLSFDTEEEVQRVLRNLIKGTTGGELSRNAPMIVADTVDGRRISVSRPPMTDTWVGLIRKFDTVYETSLEKLYEGYPEQEIIPKLLRFLIQSGRNIAITGEMASGKTTLFRACLAEISREMNLRIIEVDSFELNVRGFLPNVNSMTMRVTEQTPAEEVLAFARKTTGQIFAIGEINSAAVAAMAMDLSKIASQLFFSAHYITTEHMIADFVNAKLCKGGYSEERLAEMDVVRCLGFDVHLRIKQGKRYVQYINEIIPVVKEDEQGKSYTIRQIYRYDEEKNRGIIINTPGEASYEKAKQLMGSEEYLEFTEFFKG